MVGFLRIAVLFLFGQPGKVTHSLLPLVVTVAVQVMHLLATGRIEVQLVELQDGPGNPVEGLHALRDCSLYDFAAGHLMIPVADLVELFLQRTLSETHITVTADFVAHETNPFGGIPLSLSPAERRLCFFMGTIYLITPNNS